jgi:alcohol dehydrogenase class IV
MGAGSNSRAIKKNMLTAPNIIYVTNIYFGPGALKALPDVLNKHKMLHPLVITDSGLVKMGVPERLGINSAVVFGGVETNPTEAMALEALHIYRKSGCDGIIAAGGGSSIDLAKCVRILVYHEPPLMQYSIREDGTSRVTSYMPPMIAIPTTSGSGSEVGRAALLTIPGEGKLGFLSNHLLPAAAICDPELTMELPPVLTAATGMDALSHCIETFCSPRYNPVADAIALDGLERGFHNILKATRDGHDKHARTEMMMCSLQGGLTFQKGLGAVHSLSHPLGGLTTMRLHHGTLNAIFLPVVLRYNFDYCKDKMQSIARRLGITDASALPERFEKLNAELGLPSRLGDLGVKQEDLAHLAGQAKEDHCTTTNPRTIEVEDFRTLYAKAL